MEYNNNFRNNNISLSNVIRRTYATSLRELRQRPRIRMPFHSRYLFLDYLKTDFGHQLKYLRAVSPYLKYTSTHFYRNVTRTGTIDITELYGEESVRWIAHLPEVLIDHEFEDSKHAAFAINLKNIYSDEMHEQYVIDEWLNLTDELFLPEGFNELVNVCDGINYRFMDVGRVIREGDYHFMTMMVKYGVVRPTFQRSSSYILKDYMLWLAQTDQIPRRSDIPDPPSVAHRRHLEDDANIAAHDLLAYDEIIDPDHEAKLLRLQTVVNVIPILDKPESQELKHYENIVACIRLYFEALSEPVVSFLEIYQLLESASEMKEYYSTSRKAESFNRYKDVFPDCDGLQPRTLKHLSRCVLRRILCKRGQLPLVISKLPVPQSIKDYIQIV